MSESRHGFPITPIITVGNIWSMVVTIVGGVASLLIFAWWLSGYLHGFQDSINQIQLSVNAMQTAQQLSHEALANLDKRLIPLEMSYAGEGARRDASDARVLKVEQAANEAQREANVAQQNTQEVESKIEQELAKSNAELQALNTKYAAIYKDLAGFKCKVFPKVCVNGGADQ